MVRCVPYTLASEWPSIALRRSANSQPVHTGLMRHAGSRLPYACMAGQVVELKTKIQVLISFEFGEKADKRISQLSL